MELKRKIRRFVKTKKFKKRLCLFLIIFAIISIFFGVYNFLLKPQIKLKGEKNVVINYKEKYTEKGYNASHIGEDISKAVKVSGKVDSEKLGTYTITYEVSDGIFKDKVTRKVIVKDKKKPKMNITSDDLYICPGDDVVPEKVKATDNYDGDISNKVKNRIEEDKITYSVTDTSGNTTKIEKKIIYKDIEKPEIKLNGNETLYIFVGDNFEDPGVNVSDNCTKNIESKVKTDNNVDTKKVGTYEIKYSVEDDANNINEITRKVVVSERNKNGTIYLTFDDGPNEGTTNIILDILKEEGVEATFFVTNKGPDELIKREYDEGHTVALHTATHDYSIVYASNESYFNDLYSVQDRVKRITGYESKIIRFPGGSSNTVSRKYTQGIMSYLTQEVQNRGFKYYDWNVSSGDAAGGTPSPDDIYNNVVNSLRKDRVNMVLMHDIKTYTRDALRNIIKYGKENGYTFEKITMSTEMVTQRVNN